VTIRDHLKLRAFLARVGGWVCVVALLTVAFRYLKLSWGPYGLYAVAGALAIGGLLWVLEQQLVRCPRCNGSLTRLYTQISLGRANSCPHCGTSFDEPYPIT
jgi:DNA-directed RNA polymerase subunit RPC12/RpoP